MNRTKRIRPLTVLGVATAICMWHTWGHRRSEFSRLQERCFAVCQPETMTPAISCSAEKTSMNFTSPGAPATAAIRRDASID